MSYFKILLELVSLAWQENTKAVIENGWKALKIVTMALFMFVIRDGA